MQLTEQHGYGASEITAALQGQNGPRNWSFRYELFDKDGKYVRPLTNILGGSISYDGLAEVQRTAKFSLVDDASIDLQSARIKPYVRLEMPSSVVETSYEEAMSATIPFPMARWKMDGFSASLAVADSSGFARNGTRGPDTTAGTPAVLNDNGRSIATAPSATRGTASVEVPSPTWLDGFTALAFGCWVKATALTTNEQGIIERTANGMRLRFDSGSTGTITAQLNVYPTSGPAVVTSVTSTPYLQTTDRLFIVVTWASGEGMRLFVNGQDVTASRVNSGAVGSTKSVDTSSLFIGEGQALNRGFNGRIDDVFISGRYVALEDVQLLYIAGVHDENFRSGFVEWPQGVFLLSSPTRQVNETGVVTREVEAYDQQVILQSELLPEPFYVGAGEKYTNVVNNILSSTAGIMGRSIVQSTATLPVARMWDTGTTKLQVINDLLAAINYEALFFDENGLAVARPYLTLENRPSQYTYDDSEVSVLLPDVSQTLDLFAQPNMWVMVVSDPERPVMRVTATNTNPSSPVSTVARGRTITKVYTEQDAVDLATLQAKVNRLALESSMVFETVEFSTGLMPVHQHMDIYTLNYSALRLIGKFTETKWSFDLTAGSQMKHSARRVVSLV